jgi:cytochrome bd-type quinol oxidase subunit 2
MAIYAYILFVHEKIEINIQYTYYSAIFLILLLPVLVHFKFTVYFIMIFLVIAFLVYKTANTIDKKAEAKMKSLLPCLYVIILFVSWAIFFGDPKYTNIFIHYLGFVIGSLLIPLMFRHS